MQIEITKKEAQLIIGALAFTSCTDVCENTTKNEKYDMIHIANKLKYATNVKEVPDFYLAQNASSGGEVLYCDDPPMIDSVKNVIGILKKEEE